jgi:1-acyl-sn-glycerol-3-phosphate acyltransferase
VLQWLGSLVFTCWLFVSVGSYGLIVVLSGLFGYRTAYRAVRLWVDVTLSLAERLCGLGYEVVGLERLPAENCVVLMKHSSAWETIAQIKLFPRQTWVLKRELLWAPVLGWILLLLKPIAINRRGGRRAVEQVIEQGRDRLKQGLWIVIFPEGTRMPAGQTRRYGLSGTLLAQAAGCPIVPVAHDAGRYWPRRGLLKRRGTIRVVVGEPIATANRDPRSINDEVQGWIEAEVRRMEQRGIQD